MAYEKRVCVMKQVKKGFTADGGALSGAVYAERTGETLKITPRLLGLAPVRDGRYVLIVRASGQTFCLDFSEGVIDEFQAPSIKEGFCALLCYVRAGGAEAVAFGACGKENATVQSLLLAVSEAGGEKKKRRPANPLPPNELPTPMPNVPLAPTPVVPDPLPEETEENRPFRDGLAAAYDDEAIASSDYYAHDEDESAANADRKKASEIAGGRDSCKDEAVPPRPAGRTLTYYNTVREKLSEAFEKFPPDKRLLTAFPQSEWVNSGEALLGTVYENGLPRYLCVAREQPFPEGIKAVFVPFAPFSEKEGMYIVFQDADTGDYVTVRDA